MPSAEERAVRADAAPPAPEDLDGGSPDFGPAPGADPGEPDGWEIVRVLCPECHRAIALIGDEEQLPQHAVVRQPWHPFEPALCAGSGLLTEQLPVMAPDPGEGRTDTLAALLTLPAELDWRTQPFSHAHGVRAAAAGGAAAAHRVPSMRPAPRGRLVHQ
ncbi:hypothetical protein LN042_02280 [Kitasatospora sp. RB6PN24]|uniref:hypothetical protein n=1 Tax=Kitasatospora humi TaxID=2893891 RepID=UPI001E5C495A|nr:hypothetical protein [Kitasatospora humi]MCC9305945.1 hypothetical protein [Kitasatospora humi]